MAHKPTAAIADIPNANSSVVVFINDVAPTRRNDSHRFSAKSYFAHESVPK